MAESRLRREGWGRMNPPKMRMTSWDFSDLTGGALRNETENVVCGRCGNGNVIFRLQGERANCGGTATGATEGRGSSAAKGGSTRAGTGYHSSAAQGRSERTGVDQASERQPPSSRLPS